jgi:hypothetical protein
MDVTATVLLVVRQELCIATLANSRSGIGQTRRFRTVERSTVRAHYHFDAAILLVAEGLIEFGGVQVSPMGDHESQHRAGPAGGVRHTRRPTAALHWRCSLTKPACPWTEIPAVGTRRFGVGFLRRPAASNPGVLPSLAPTGYRIACFWRRRSSSLHPGISKFPLESQIRSLGFDPPMNRPHYTVSAQTVFLRRWNISQGVQFGVLQTPRDDR